jgi:tetratricopeptide (TPR) repeat protein
MPDVYVHVRPRSLLVCTRMVALTAIAGAILLALPCCSRAQHISVAGTRIDGQKTYGAGQITVVIQEATGSAFQAGATIDLVPFDTSSDIAGKTTLKTAAGGTVVFSALVVGNYLVEVTSPGYKPVQEHVSVTKVQQQQDLLIAMVPDTAGGKTRGRSSATSPKAVKETELGLKYLQIGNLEEAQGHLKRALAAAPDFPDASYLMGVVFLRSRDASQARGYLQKAVTLDPNHAAALLALGEAQYSQRDYREAVKSLEQSLSVRPNVWRAQWLAASADYQLRDFQQARDHAMAAAQSGQDSAGSARLLLGQAQAALDERDAAVATLEQFLREQPKGSSNAAVQNLIVRLRAPKPTAPEIASETAKGSASEGLPSDGSAIETAILGDESLLALPPIVPMTEANWAPPDIDQEQLALDSAAPESCPLDATVEGAGGRVMELVKNVDRFTATEDIEHLSLSPMGVPISRETRKFNYLVEIKQFGTHQLDVQEYRNGSVSPQQFPAHIGTNGLPTLALVFHPYYRDEYKFTCEGHGMWRGRPAWVVHFQHRSDTTGEMLVYRVKSKSFAVGLKGRAWIDENTSEVLAMESDLMRPLPDIHLMRDHQLIEYGPVDFREGAMRLWLPKSADWFCSLSGQRYHRRHSFSHFLLFSVDDSQKISKPPEPPPDQP